MEAVLNQRTGTSNLETRVRIEHDSYGNEHICSLSLSMCTIET